MDIHSTQSAEQRGEAVALQDLAAGLSRAAAYPRDPSPAPVELIQTHLSWVFLTRERVYKLRKPVAFGFVDFATRAARNRDCLREVALNRRLAPDVYLGVAAVAAGPAGPELGPLGETLTPGLEHCVVMRRLPAGRDALSLLRCGALSAARLDALAARLAHFHAGHGLGAPAPFTSDEWHARCCQPLHACLRSLEALDAPLASAPSLRRCAERVRAFERESAGVFEARRQQGRAVDAHGDLHLDHVWFENDVSGPIAIDCLEFDAALRHIDAASEVAFLAMDLHYREAPRLAERFLSAYAGEADDHGLYALVDYFMAYRALVRAKVAGLASRDHGIPELQRERAAESAGRHVELADALLARQRGAVLVAVGGAVGTGKSSVAGMLADQLGGAVISSDRVRKHRLGIAPNAPAPHSAYEPEARRRVYGALLERAEPVLRSGRSAVLDATFGCAALRDPVRALGERHALRTLFVEVRCRPELARRRLARRAAAGHSASDAGPELHAASAVGFEPAHEWPAAAHVVIETDRAGWPDAVAKLCRQIEAAT